MASQLEVIMSEPAKGTQIAGPRAVPIFGSHLKDVNGSLSSGSNIDWSLVQRVKNPTRKATSTHTSRHSPPNLSKPLDDTERRLIAKRFRKLTERRDELDEALIREAAKKRAYISDYLYRANLVVQHGKLQKRELRHIRRYQEILNAHEKVHRRNPTEETKKDVDLIRILLWKFKRNLGPSMGSIQEAERSPRNNGVTGKLSSGGSGKAVSPDTSTTPDDSSIGSEVDPNVAKKRKRQEDELDANTVRKSVKSSALATAQSKLTSDLKAKTKVKEKKAERLTKRKLPTDDGEVTEKKAERSTKRKLLTDDGEVTEKVARSDLTTAPTTKKQNVSKTGSDVEKGQALDKAPLLTEKSVKGGREDSTPAEIAISNGLATKVLAPEAAQKKPTHPKKVTFEEAEPSATSKSKQRAVDTEPARDKGPKPAASASSPLANKASLHSGIDLTKEYFFRRRKQILDDPLGFDDCVEDRQRKFKTPSNPFLMSGACYPGVTFDDNGNRQSLAPDKQGNHANLEGKKANNNVGPQRKKSKYIVAPTHSGINRKENSRSQARRSPEANNKHRNGQPTNSHSGPRSTDLRTKFARKAPNGKGKAVVKSNHTGRS